MIGGPPSIDQLRIFFLGLLINKYSPFVKELLLLPVDLFISSLTQCPESSEML
jgi:hypothetical protein